MTSSIRRLSTWAVEIVTNVRTRPPIQSMPCVGSAAWLHIGEDGRKRMSYYHFVSIPFNEPPVILSSLTHPGPSCQAKSGSGGHLRQLGPIKTADKSELVTEGTTWTRWTAWPRSHRTLVHRVHAVHFVQRPPDEASIPLFRTKRCIRRLIPYLRGFTSRRPAAFMWECYDAISSGWSVADGLPGSLRMCPGRAAGADPRRSKRRRRRRTSRAQTPPATPVPVDRAEQASLQAGQAKEPSDANEPSPAQPNECRQAGRWERTAAAAVPDSNDPVPMKPHEAAAEPNRVDSEIPNLNHPSPRRRASPPRCPSRTAMPRSWPRTSGRMDW